MKRKRIIDFGYRCLLKAAATRTLEFRKSRDELYAKVEPLHWASAKPCPEAIMQEWITIGSLDEIRQRFGKLAGNKPGER